MITYFLENSKQFKLTFDCSNALSIDIRGYLITAREEGRTEGRWPDIIMYWYDFFIISKQYFRIVNRILLGKFENNCGVQKCERATSKRRCRYSSLFIVSWNQPRFKVGRDSNNFLIWKNQNWRKFADLFQIRKSVHYANLPRNVVRRPSEVAA